jgi:Ca2+-binding RTX toxin-like protein
VAAIKAAVTGTLIAVAPTQVGAKIKVAAAGVVVTTSAVADFTIVAKTKYVGSTNLPIVATGMASVDEIASATLAAINAQSGIGVLELSGTISASSVITLTNFALAVGTAIVSADTAFATVVPTPGVAADIAGAATDGESSENDDVQATVENVIGGAGADTLDASQATLAQHVLMGMAGNDLLIGSDLADTLYGGPGDDKLHGGGDADLLIGGDGNDVLQGGLGNDTIDGDGTNCTKTALPSSGTFPQAAALSAVPFISAKCDSKFQPAAATAGSNTLDYSDHIVGVTVTLPSGLATVSTPVSLDLANGGETETVVVRNISTTKTASYAVSAANVNGSSDVDHITCSDDLACMVHGNGGNDIITGGALGDALYGDSGNDTVLGMAGNDVISGGAGKDTLTGGTGNDLIDAQDGEADTAIDCGGEDSDLLIFDSALDGTGLVGYSADTAGCIGH